jgi:Predicted membrane protein
MKKKPEPISPPAPLPKVQPVAANYAPLLKAIFALYILLLLAGVYLHEPWRDEAQSWLMARDNSLGELLQGIRGEAHPPLWYLIIMPFARLGAPYAAQNCIAAIISAAAVYVLLFNTRLPVLLKCLLPFGCFLLYDYSVFARSYCLIPLFIALLLSLYPKRFEKPWLYALCVIGLFNTHVLAFTFCCGLVALYFWDSRTERQSYKQTIAATIAMLVGGLYLVPYLAGQASGAFEPEPIGVFELVDRALRIGLTSIDSFVPGSLVLVAIVVLLGNRPKLLMLLFAGISGVVFILAFKYNSTAMRHLGFIFFVALFTIGISPYYSHEGDNWLKGRSVQYAQWLLVVLVVAHIYTGATSYLRDAKANYSDSRNAANFLKEKGLDDKILVGAQAWSASAIAPYLPGKQFYYGECRRYGTFYIYDNCFTDNHWRFPVDYSVGVAYDVFKQRLDDVVLVFNHPVTPQQLRYLDVLYATPEQPLRSSEAYYIYKFKDAIQ